jgi:hypothetical protein
MFPEAGNQSKDTRLSRLVLVGAPLAILLAIVIRAGTYLWLHEAGYFYGMAWDSFSRTLLAYRWSEAPCFYCYGGYWMPLQYWLVGSIYGLIEPILDRSEIHVPVAVNNLFWIGSLWVTYRIGERISGKAAGLIACVLAAWFAGDIFVTYTALSEPVLIFFMLLTSCLLVDFLHASPEEKGTAALKLGAAALLASATHYVGWFAALCAAFFLLAAAIDALRKRERHWLVYLGAALLCMAMLLVWMGFTYQAYGDPLRSVQVAREYQLEGVGAFSPGERLLLPLRVLVGKFTGITVAGMLSIYFVYRKTPRSLWYLALPAFVLGLLWASTALGLSAPDQEPRYLVFWGWATLPYIAYTIVTLWQRPELLWKFAVALGVFLLLFENALDLRSFENYFGADVRDAGVQAELFLKEGEGHEVLLEGNTFQERWVIPVVSGHPERVSLISANELEKNWDETAAELLSPERDRLVIVKSNRFVKLARELGLTVSRIGQYFVIYPPGEP